MDEPASALTPLEASCQICFGVGTWGEQAYACRCKEAPAPAVVRKVLMLLSVEQMAFLRRFEHTLAEQPVTGEEWDAALCEYWVEDDDAVIDEQSYDVLVPATKIWFAGGRASMGPQHDGVKTWISYNRLGLALRECLMAGADARCRP